jgi:hypothetical protein
MYNIIILDTNIYRQLGTRFYNHIDYKGLDDYCYSSGSDIILTNTVLREYLDFYRRDVIDKNIQEIERTYERLQKLEKFEKIRKPNFTKQANEQLKFIENKLTQYRLKPKLDLLLNESDLLEFLIVNKQESKKDNTRDYLIWLNALSAAKVYPDSTIVLISEDKIFSENPHFLKIREKHAIKHFETYNSIPAFLSIYGFKSEKLTKDLILEKIPVGIIQRELLKHKNAIPGYISNFYSTVQKKFKLEKFEIQDVKVDEFYSHKDINTGNVKVIAHVLVKVNMIFSPERNKGALQKHLETAKVNDPYLMETFDEKGRPIFNEYILFHFLLNFSEETNQISQVKFLDFFPDNYQYLEIRKQLS